MNKQDIYNFLDSKNIHYEITEHTSVFNMEEMAKIPMPYPEADAKNLFVRDDKKRNYYLITVKGDKKVDLKVFRKAYGTRQLSFASPEDLMNIMGLIPGAVSPLGILNDHEHKVHFYIDSELVKLNMIGLHPNDNTATVWMQTQALIDIIKDHGNTVDIFETE